MNAVNDVLRLLEMVRVVKDDGKVTVAYMKSFEIEQMWINKLNRELVAKESVKG